MKKKKTDQKAPADFKHTPFTSLKGFAPQSATPDKKEIPRRKQEKQHEDDSELFLRAVAGSRKIDDDVSVAGSVAQKKAAAQPRPDVVTRDNELFLEAMKQIGTTFKDVPLPEQESLDPERRSASSRMRQLKRGTIRISQELDLHGFLKDEALKRLESFIAGAFSRSQQAVLVITGKGINSPEGPVLQGAVATWLRERGKGKVAEFAPAPRDLGGSGAVVVFLKKK